MLESIDLYVLRVLENKVIIVLENKVEHGSTSSKVTQSIDLYVSA